jgi:hypothetical protein
MHVVNASDNSLIYFNVQVRLVLLTTVLLVFAIRTVDVDVTANIRRHTALATRTMKCSGIALVCI